MGRSAARVPKPYHLETTEACNKTDFDNCGCWQKKPLIGPLVGTIVVSHARGLCEVRRPSLGEDLSQVVPLVLSPFFQTLRRLDDGRATCVLIFCHALRLLVAEVGCVDQDSGLPRRLSLVRLLSEGGAVFQAVNRALERIRIVCPRSPTKETMASFCIAEALSSRVSASLAACFCRLIMAASVQALSSKAPESVSFESFISFSECEHTVEKDSSVGNSYGFLLRDCPRSVLVEGVGSAILLRVYPGWMGISEIGTSDTDSDASDEGGGAYTPAFDVGLVLPRFRQVIRSLRERSIRLVITTASFPQCLVNAAAECNITFAHSVDASDMGRFARCADLRMCEVRANRIEIDGDDCVFAFEKCWSQGHGSSADTQYIELTGIIVRGAPICALHVRVPSGKMIPLYRSCLLSGYRILQTVWSEGFVVGGGCYLNELGGMLIKESGEAGSALRPSLLLVGEALRHAALEMALTRKHRQELISDPSLGMYVSGAYVAVRSKSDLLSLGVMLPFVVARGTIITAIQSIAQTLGIGDVVVVKHQ